MRLCVCVLVPIKCMTFIKPTIFVIMALFPLPLYRASSKLKGINWTRQTKIFALYNSIMINHKIIKEKWTKKNKINNFDSEIRWINILLGIQRWARSEKQEIHKVGNIRRNQRQIQWQNMSRRYIMKRTEDGESERMAVRSLKNTWLIYKKETTIYNINPT